MPSIAFSWFGLPQYAARLIRGAIEILDQECFVVGSKPNVPVLGIEAALGQRILWVDPQRPIAWKDIGIDIPQVFVQSGWGYPAFTSLGRQVKANGGRIIGLSDANWRGDFRQLIFGPLIFRTLYRKHFDAMLVPGRQGQRLMKWFGMPDSRVRAGMYGADRELFKHGPSLPTRPKTFLFVGQFIERKGVLGLSRAFMRFSKTHPDWALHLCGSGVQRESIPVHDRLLVEDFVQPEGLAARFHESRFLVLPSTTEAWGLVVHEAALCGCALVLSDAIGSADDLASVRNAIRFRANDEDDLYRALVDAAALSDDWFAAAEHESKSLACHFGPTRFAAELKDLIETFEQDQ